MNIDAAELAAVREQTRNQAWDQAPARVRAVLCVYMGLPRPYARLKAEELTEGERAQLASKALHLADQLKRLSDLALAIR